MTRAFLAVVLMTTVLGCKPKPAKTPQDNFNADARSGLDAKRSGAQVLPVNRPHTDEVSYINQDKTDWYQVELKGKPGVLTSFVHWDNDQSDIMIDVFDEFGAQIAASPVRTRGAKAKTLLTQIDRVGTYYIRVTAPTRADGSVYTLEAKWEEPPPPPPPPQVVEPPPPPPPTHRQPRPRPEPRVEKPEKPEKPLGDTVQARIVSAYRDGNGLVLYIDKGSAAGIKQGAAGAVLTGPAGEEPMDGGELRVTRVLGSDKCMATTTLRSVGRNFRVAISINR